MLAAVGTGVAAGVGGRTLLYVGITGQMQKEIFFKKIILDECSTVFEMDQVRSRKAGWVGQMMAK